MSKVGVLICGHGSRDVRAVEEFGQLVGSIRAALPMPVESGFLEFARPVIGEAVDRLREQAVDHVLAVPGMLFAAGHVKNDVPSVLNEQARRTGMRIEFGRDLGIDPKLLQAARDRIEAALAASEREAGAVPRERTLLAVIGRGTSDPDANGDVFKVARMLAEGMGFGWVEIGYSGVAHPRVDAALERACRLGFEQIVVFPWFLFTGVLIRRIYDQTDEVAARHPEVRFLKAGYLGDHPLVAATFLDRIAGISTADVNMNCMLCKYREQIVGHESAVGVPQVGHHHHVEGIGTDGGHHHHHGDQGHHHHRHGDHGHHHGSGHDTAAPRPVNGSAAGPAAG